MIRNKEEILCGGVTDRTDTSAPKQIASKDITDFYANFFLSNRCTSDDRHNFCFSVKQVNGSTIACDEIKNISFEADEQLLCGLQQIIDRHELAKLNGLYKVTAGLPPEYQPSRFCAGYCSGETLGFTQNNDPFAIWAEEIYTLFAQWFCRKGEDSLMPPRETTAVKRIRLRYIRQGIYTEYGGVNVDRKLAINGQSYLLEKTIYDDNAKKTLVNKLVPFPQDYFAAVTKILFDHSTDLKYDQSRYDYEAGNYGNHDRGYFGFGSMPTSEEDSKELSVSLHAEYESGNRLNIDTLKASEIEGMKPLLEELFAYYDTVFGE